MRAFSVSASAFKRFYKQAYIQAAEGGFVVKLDKFTLKTPHKRVLLLPSEALALAVATEFEAQTTEMNYYSMPLFKLASAGFELQAEGLRKAVVTRISTFIENDTSCYRDHVVKLRSMQQEYFNPLLQHLKDKYAIELSEVSGTS
jgi:ATP synthase F1 complex assembly factor 2